MTHARTSRRHAGKNQGTANSSAKLNADEVAEIRTLHDEGENRATLARAYGVHPSTISSIIRGALWKMDSQHG